MQSRRLPCTFCFEQFITLLQVALVCPGSNDLHSPEDKQWSSYRLAKTQLPILEHRTMTSTARILTMGKHIVYITWYKFPIASYHHTDYGIDVVSGPLLPPCGCKRKSNRALRIAMPPFVTALVYCRLECRINFNGYVYIYICSHRWI